MNFLTFAQLKESSREEQVDIIVFSHLRWEFVKQRPQHLLGRFSQKNRVLFVEEPIPVGKANYGSAHIINVSDHLRVLQPRIQGGDFASLAKIIHTHGNLSNSRSIAWFYSAAFLPVLNYLESALIVYDCMDELSAFKGASKRIIIQEKKLLNLADVVFTGGKSLYESKRLHNQNTYCFPSSVEKNHFEKAFARATKIPADIAKIAQPIVGFYGVIDERMDLELLQQVAVLNPKIAFVMIGPVVKIDELNIPHAHNIYYLGNKSYEMLPGYLKAFDICMMPFALNESTRFISPTKTLEFIAAHKPIISTPIYDVKRDYSDVVKIVSTAVEFSDAITAYLSESKLDRQTRINFQKALIDQTSWDKTVANMQTVIRNTLRKYSHSKSTSETVAHLPIQIQLV